MSCWKQPLLLGCLLYHHKDDHLEQLCIDLQCHWGQEFQFIYLFSNSPIFICPLCIGGILPVVLLTNEHK